MKLKLLVFGVGAGAAAIAGIAILGRDAGPSLPADARADSVFIDKTGHTMTLFSGGQTLRTYAVSLGRGGLKAKTREGDNRTPEGSYLIDARNPRSAFHLSLHISYPDARDTAAAVVRGEKPGDDIMIHGIRNGLGWLGIFHRWVDWTAGCVAVTDVEMEEVWRVVPDGTPVEIRR
ncbi:L,D-transpeptidase family protein [Rhizobium sp. Pop5]|uniref:L,D-transpeptidase family protein n=1 Tax=Rhizobium sp. Pop5 TaxID=1223565 RepID=UPI000283902A|nr:L,D-transpeptidase family protein [Rhizobium sp. Pop5]EJZ16698.1 lipoprotein [Rhizobium sp. Pop5]UVD56268.1 L,D-transpeptidase family protein [Rhizobium sp. Pop5]